MSAPSPSCPGAPDWLLPFVSPPPEWAVAPAGRSDERIPLLRSLHRHRWEILAHYPRTALYQSSLGPKHDPGEVGPTLLLWALSPWFTGVCPECRGTVIGLAAGGRGHRGSVRGRCLGCAAEVWRRSSLPMHDYCERLLKAFAFVVQGWVPFCHSIPWEPHSDVLRLLDRLDARSPALAGLLSRLDSAEQEGATLLRRAELASPELNALLVRVPELPEGGIHA